MNKKEMIRMAKDTEIDDWWDSGNEEREVLQQHLERFAALVAAAERERCAKECENLREKWIKGEITNTEHTITDFAACAAAIRALT